MSWILAISQGKKVAAYLSDIAGAFDRVCREYLLAKLYTVGMGTTYLNFLASYSNPRKASVVVEGIMSDEIVIANTVFQERCWVSLCGTLSSRTREQQLKAREGGKASSLMT